MTWMTCMMHGMVPCSCCTSRSSTGLQVGKSRFVMVAMTWKVYDWTHVFASFVMETTSEWKVWPRHWRSTRRSSSRLQPNVSSSHGFNDKFGLGMFGLTSFQNTFSIMSLRKAQHWLNPPKVCKSNLHTALSHFSLKPVRNLGAYLGPNSCPFKLSGSPGRQTHRWPISLGFSRRSLEDHGGLQGFGQDPAPFTWRGQQKEGSGGTMWHPWHDWINMSDLTIPSLYLWELWILHGIVR